MIELDAAARAALDQWRFDTAEPAWADVRSRAGAAGRAPSVRPLLVAAVAAVGLLLSIPAFGVGGRLTRLISGSTAPGLRFAATVETASGVRVGTFSLRTSRLFVTMPRSGKRPRPIPFTRPGRLPVATARWTLALDRPASEARIERVVRSNRRVLVGRLCGSCASDSEGTLNLRREALGGLFGGRLVVVVRTDSGSAEGVVRSRPPRR